MCEQASFLYEAWKFHWILKTQISNFELSFEIFYFIFFLNIIILFPPEFYFQLLSSLIRAGFWIIPFSKLEKYLFYVLYMFLCFKCILIYLFVFCVAHFISCIFLLSAKALYKNKSAKALYKNKSALHYKAAILI